MAADPLQKVREQIRDKCLPAGGTIPFVPMFDKNKRGEVIVKKTEVEHGPKAGKVGYTDTQGRIWIRDRGHAGRPDHWDVQEDGGRDYFRVDDQGEILA